MQALSRDSRWRLREAVAWALQILLRQRQREALRELSAWLVPGDPLLARAVAAAVAEPALLEGHEFAERPLALHRRLMSYVEVQAERRCTGFGALRKALGYTLSVVVAALPDPGLASLEELVTLEDRDIRWIVRENLGKKRLSSRWPEEVARLDARLRGEGRHR